jgi:hypothetical protein
VHDGRVFDARLLALVMAKRRAWRCCFDATKPIHY